MFTARRILRLGQVFFLPIVFSAGQILGQASSENANAAPVTLLGTLHPLARAAADRGMVSLSAPSGRILLMLQRPADKEAALQQYLIDVNTPASSTYRHWLKPDEFGHRFGPSDDSIHAVDTWLASLGFTITRHSHSRSFIEFTGTVGQLNQAFHTEIHQYQVNGELHRANATPLTIPQSLASIIKTVSPLNDFSPKSSAHTAGTANYNTLTRQFHPEYTVSSGSTSLYPVAPADFATQYDLLPLAQTGVNGKGTTIGIIDEINIDLGISNAFRSAFGLAANPVQVIIDGIDPGQNSIDAVATDQTYLNVELAGGVAPGATVNLYIASADGMQNPPLVAAERAVEDDQADVLSVGSDVDEYQLTSSNVIWNELWEQAAAQGQTVVVATGDNGSYGNEFLSNANLNVNGLASTPWNIAVGGTDFFYGDYASGAPSAATLWNATNDPVTRGSLKAPLPEQVWNTPFGLNAAPLSEQDLGGGGTSGGGASNCINVATLATCTSGYPKPAWQTGLGVPADSARDVPDVSLFAGTGGNFSSYVVCSLSGECIPDSNGNITVNLAGGTSASASAMAGIMALVVQKYGRQGQAAPVLYALAQQKPATFHDITTGNNEYYCQQGTLDCIFNNSVDSYVTTVYPATPNFDLATGLGSIDAAALVSNWGGLTFQATSTTLTASATNITHGQPITLSSTVMPTSGTGTPTGAVALLSMFPLSPSQGQGAITLSNGSGSATVSTLPGGTYQLTGHYGGDGMFASSTSQPVSLTVGPESSETLLNFSSIRGTAGPFLYGDAQSLVAQVLNGSGKNDGAATGSVLFTLDGSTTSIPLSRNSTAELNTAFTVGNHTATASFPGDASYSSSTSSPVSFTIQKGLPFINLYNSSPNGVKPGNTSFSAGEPVFIGVEVSSASVVAPGTLAPTGNILVELLPSQLGCGTGGVPSYAQSAPLTTLSGQYSTISGATVEFPSLSAGDYAICVLYLGDSNWESDGVLFVGIDISVGGTPPPPSQTVLAISPTSYSGNQTGTLSVSVSGNPVSSPAPTGHVELFDNGVDQSGCTLVAQSNSASICTYPVGINSFESNGSNSVSAIYFGDQNYQPSSSNIVVVQSTQTGNFTLSVATSQVTVAEGASTTVGLSLAEVGNLSTIVNLTCATSSPDVTCSISPSSVTLNGTASSTLTLTAAATLANSMPLRKSSNFPWHPVEASLGLLLLTFLPNSRRRIPALLNVFILAALTLTSGCGSASTPATVNSTTPVTGTAATYTVSVTGNASGVIHNANLAVIVTSTH